MEDLGHALVSSHLVRLNIFEIVSYNNNHVLKPWFVINRIIETLRKVHLFREMYHGRFGRV